MKKNFNTGELAHVWARQTQDEGKTGSFYFRGKTIYSYGSHFPIATIEGNDVFFTKKKYSITTSGHITLAKQAISHKNIIYCYDVPVNLKYASNEHEKNLHNWLRDIQNLFTELGNKRNKNVQGRINEIARLIDEVEIYCKYFKLKIKDKELKKLIALAGSPDFVQQAIDAKAKQDTKQANKMKQASKAYEKYIKLWRNYKEEDTPENIRELVRFYTNQQDAQTRLRYNVSEKRIETSKGVQIPVEIAKRAFKQLNGCMEGTCDSISVPVMHYNITKTTKDSIIAGCHTIPKADVFYISNLLNW